MTIIILMTVVLALFGVGIAVWSFINTRKKYYTEYIKRRGEKSND